MADLPEITYACPYCGELIVCLVDPHLGGYQTIEDCLVCCRPIELTIEPTETGWQLSAHTDSD